MQYIKKAAIEAGILAIIGSVLALIFMGGQYFVVEQSIVYHVGNKMWLIIWKIASISFIVWFVLFSIIEIVKSRKQIHIKKKAS